MKGVGKVILIIFSLSLFFVLYVREQIALLHVSYQIESKTEKVTQLSEEYRRLQFEVDQLKAPRLLEEKMKQHSMELSVPQEIRVIRLPAKPAISEPLQRITVNPSMSVRLSNFLGRWIDVAQAKTND